MAEENSKPMRLVHKVTLSGSKKNVILDDLTLQHEEMAYEIAASKYRDNPMMMALASIKEILKLLIVEVDGKAPSAIERETVDKQFTYGEWKQLESVVIKLKGTENPTPQVETVSYTAK